MGQTTAFKEENLSTATIAKRLNTGHLIVLKVF